MVAICDKMLSDVSFRKTSRCNYYEHFIASKPVPQFPVLRINSDQMPRSAINQLIYESGFNKPFVIVGNTQAVGIKIPSNSMTFTDITQIVGPQTPTKLIEVGQQTEISGYTLAEYAEYLQSRTRNHKTLNMITLEFSATPLNSKVLAPSFVRNIDWIDSIWPLERRSRGDYPKVQKYCLAGMATSYTDFHIDFGGTSVWYHVLSGKKRFYLVPPTVDNLKKYEKWSNSPNQADIFFGDLVTGQCFQFDLSPGETLMIPSGWIHSVYTPEDSLVFGGNFVHSFSILRQLQVYLLEYRTRVGDAYRFPFFREINWYFLCVLLPVVRKQYLPHDSPTKIDAAAKVATLAGDGDDDDDLVALGVSLLKPTIFNQLPYLVRTCEIWLTQSTQALSESEMKVFHEAASKAKCETLQAVVDAWWVILLAIVEKVASNDMDRTVADCSLEVINRTRAASTLDLLNEEVIRHALPTFDMEMEQMFKMVGLNREVNASEEAASNNRLLNDGPVPSTEDIQQASIDSQPPDAPVLSFKLRPNTGINKTAPVATATATTTVTSTAITAITPTTYASPATSLKLEDIDMGYDSDDDNEDGVPSTALDCDLNGNSVGTTTLRLSTHVSDKPLKLNLKLGGPPADVPSRLAFKINRNPVEQIDPRAGNSIISKTTTLTKKKISKDPKITRGRPVRKGYALVVDGCSSVVSAPAAPANTVRAGPRSRIQSGYSTRGLKLSATYLQNAMDVDVEHTPDDAEENHGASSSARDGHQDDFLFHDEDAYRKGGEEWGGSEDEDGEDDDFDDNSSEDGDVVEEEDDDDVRGYVGKSDGRGRKRGRDSSSSSSGVGGATNGSKNRRVVASKPPGASTAASSYGFVDKLSIPGGVTSTTVATTTVASRNVPLPKVKKGSSMKDKMFKSLGIR